MTPADREKVSLAIAPSKYGGGSNRIQSLSEKFWKFVNQDGPVSVIGGLESKCWVWTGYLNPDGYGMVDVRNNGLGIVVTTAHRIGFLVLRGSLPPAPLELDHLCRNRACVNPCHLEVVTMKVNILRGESPFAINARKTECKHGHLLSENNVYMFRGSRNCKACRLRNSRESHRRIRSGQ
jgi:hypothetical protein